MHQAATSKLKSFIMLEEIVGTLLSMASIRDSFFLFLQQSADELETEAKDLAEDSVSSFVFVTAAECSADCNSLGPGTTGLMLSIVFRFTIGLPSVMKLENTMCEQQDLKKCLF